MRWMGILISKVVTFVGDGEFHFDDEDNSGWIIEFF